MALVSCSECQSQVSDRAVSCPHCGNVFTRCPECGNEVRASDAACKSCGYPLGVAASAAESPYTARVLPANTASFAITGGATALVYAGFWRRFAAFVIDFIVLTVVFVVISVVLGVLFKSSTLTDIFSEIWIGVTLGYFVSLESSRIQATIGKRALGIIVTDVHGDRVSTKRALGRYCAKVLSTATLLIGYFMAGFTEKKQALHDMIAGTLVVVKPTSG